MSGPRSSRTKVEQVVRFNTDGARRKGPKTNLTEAEARGILAQATEPVREAALRWAAHNRVSPGDGPLLQAAYRLAGTGTTTVSGLTDSILALPMTKAAAERAARERAGYASPTGATRI